MNSPEIKKFIRENSSLFQNLTKSIDEDLLVEIVLKDGDLEEIKKLFDAMGIKNVAKVFYQQVKRKPVKYLPREINFFHLYFQRHAYNNLNFSNTPLPI